MNTEYAALFAAGYVAAHLVSWAQWRWRRWRSERKLAELMDPLRNPSLFSTCEYIVQPNISLQDVLKASGVKLDVVLRLNGVNVKWEVGKKILLPRAACLYLSGVEASDEQANRQRDHH